MRQETQHVRFLLTVASDITTVVVETENQTVSVVCTTKLQATFTSQCYFKCSVRKSRHHFCFLLYCEIRIVSLPCH